MGATGDTRSVIARTIGAQQGVIFAQPSLVGRATYTGRDIIARNSRFAPGYQDERGYVPVEWWIMSMTAAANPRPRPNEGVTRLLVAGDGAAAGPGPSVWLTEAAQQAGDLLFGDALGRWPLTKVLDIGGEPVMPRLASGEPLSAEPEVPPIPFHVHSGEVVNGRIQPPGKLEAYFFPPVDVPPYRRQLGRVITRLGLRPQTTRRQVLEAMYQFGRSDAFYALGAVYEAHPYEGWTVPAGCVHAPGPWPTFEIQLPQDDFNWFAWQMGVQVAEAERESLRQAMMLRGLRDEEDLLEQAVDWELSTDPDFERKYHHRAQELERGPWGRRLQIFFGTFYGEAIEVQPGQRYTRQATSEPWAGIVWSGAGTLNGHPVGVKDGPAPAEFLVTPGHAATFAAADDAGDALRAFTVFPMRQ